MATLGTATVAECAEWRITPRVSARETYTDNVRLSAPGTEQSDWITEINPGVSVSARGARLQLQADYALQYKAYAKNSDSNGFSNFLGSNALWDVWNQELFLQGAATISQQNISPLGPQAQSDANITDNRTEVRTATLSPYWVRKFGDWASVNARYSWNQTQSSGDFSFYNSETNTVALGLTSGAAFGNLGWGVNYRYSQIDSSQGTFSNRNSESVNGSLRYKVLPTFALTATLGHESNDYPDVTGSKVSGRSWSFGGDWAPSTRTRVIGSYGERYFGNTKKFDASHRTRLTTWTIGYSEDVSDTPTVAGIPVSADTVATVDRLLLTRIPDAQQRQQAVQAFMTQNALPLSLDSPVEFFANQVSLVKRWHAGMGMLGTRGTLLFNLFWQDRSTLSSSTVNGPLDPFAISDTVKQVGFSTVASWRFSARTATSASVGQSRYSYPDAEGQDSNNYYFRLGLTHQFGAKLRGGLNFRWVERDADSNSGDYRERALVGTLNMAF